MKEEAKTIASHAFAAPVFYRESRGLQQRESEVFVFSFKKEGLLAEMCARLLSVYQDAERRQFAQQATARLRPLFRQAAAVTEIRLSRQMIACSSISLRGENLQRV